MKKKNLLLLQKKGQARIDNKISYLIGGVIVVVLVVSLAPTMFDEIANLTDLPSQIAFFQPVMYVIVGAGLIFLVWRTIGN